MHRARLEANVRDAIDVIEGDVKEEEVDRAGVACDAMRILVQKIGTKMSFSAVPKTKDD